MKKIYYVLAGITAISMTGCKGDGLKKITVAEVTHSIFYAPQYLAINEGYFKEEGLKISLINSGGADKTMSMLLSKEAQIGLMGSEASIYVRNGGENNYAVNFAQLTQKDGSFLVGREAIDNFDFSMLKGKSILGGRDGGMPEMVLEYILKNAGLDVGRDDNTKEVLVRTDVAFNALAGAFTAGQSDYVSLFEPTASQLEKNGTGHIVASLGAASGEIPYTCFSATKNYLEQNEEVIEKFTRAIYKGLVYVNSHTAEEIAPKIKSHFIEMSDEDLVKSIKSYKDIEAWPTTLNLSETNFNKLQDIIELAGKLDKRGKYSELVNNKFADLVKK